MSGFLYLMFLIFIICLAGLFSWSMEKGMKNKEANYKKLYFVEQQLRIEAEKKLEEAEEIIKQMKIEIDKWSGYDYSVEYLRQVIKKEE